MPEAGHPSISVIVPVWHEPDLASRLGDLWQHGPGEVIVVDGDPAGSSLAGLESSRYRTLISPRPGRGPQLRAGAEAAQGEILLFLHADTQLPARALAAISNLLQSRPELAGGAFDLGIDSPRPIYRLIESISSRRSRLTRLPYGDQALFLRRSVYEAIGGFPDEPLMEDVGICQRLKRKGYPIGFLPQRVLTSARRWEKEGILGCTLRNWSILGLYLLGMPPAKLVRVYGKSEQLTVNS
ncbi:MAG: TIGR04283 family arsenosugar biosynthesis glycosyltransferase [Candidatus Sericytochromatia bacterium]